MILAKWFISARATEPFDNFSVVVIETIDGEKFARKPKSEQDYYLNKVGITDQCPQYSDKDPWLGEVCIKAGDHVRIIPINCSSV